MPTVAELAAMDYGGSSAFALGITAEDYRSIAFAAHGETFQWYKAIPTEDNRLVEDAERNSNLYVLQELESGVLIYVHETREEEQGGEFGILPRGTTMAALMPDECWPTRGDRIVLTQREDRARVLVERTFTDDDVLIQDHAVSIIEVQQGEDTFEAALYELDTDTNSIHWLTGDRPDAEQEYSIELTYRPTYVWLPVSERLPRLGADGAYLPLRAVLQREILS